MISLLSPFKAAAIITMIRALIKLDGRTQEPVLPSLVLQGLNTYQASSPIYWPWWQQCQYIPVIFKIVSRLRSLALTQAWILPQCSKKHFLGGWLNSLLYDVAQFFIRSQAMLKAEKISRFQHSNWRSSSFPGEIRRKGKLASARLFCFPRDR